MSDLKPPLTGLDEGESIKLALAAFNAGRLADAARLCEAILAVRPDAFDPNYLLALARSKSGSQEAAIANYDRALIARPDHAEARYNRGNALLQLQRFEEALAECDRAIALRPELVEAHFNKATALIELKRFQEAAPSASEALRLRPSSPEAHKILGDAMMCLGRIADAETCYRRALKLRTEYSAALSNLCHLLMKTERYDQAIIALAKLLQLQEDYKYALGTFIYSKMHCCEWNGLASLNERLLLRVRSGRLVVSPLVLLTLPSTPADQLINARRHAEARAPVPVRRLPRLDRIRLAYLSADFRQHPVPELAVGMFERHDRSQFEIIAISFGEDDGSDVRRRLERVFDRFIDVRHMNDLQVARLVGEMGVEIAVDLMGYTDQARPDILAHRPAPIQVSYLGFPGTMGADHIDYIIADRHVIPDGERQFYAEQVVHLPDSYLVNDDRRPIADEVGTRALHGLEDGALVFCCFCGSYKITPDVFESWVTLLSKVPGSILWLRGTNESATRNLRLTAASRGVAADRLVFAPILRDVSGHLARHRLADLALDTLPYNGHTTTSDALWAGLPVITCTGDTFPGRVAASLLHAVGLPELVTGTQRDYEDLALRLATDRSYLQEVRDRLARNRLTHPLFNTDRFRRHLEAAYRTMWDIWRRGEAPRSFRVEPIPDADSSARLRA
jgi:protein O-GlcNAc transferase